MIVPSLGRIERIPAWIKRVTQDLSVSPAYDARFWNPPQDQKYTFKNQRPKKLGCLRIYEAHVGISTPEHRVGTYKEFTNNILPRIHKLGYNAIQLMAIMEHAYYACASLNRLRYCNPSSSSPEQLSVTRSTVSSLRAHVTVPRKNSRS